MDINTITQLINGVGFPIVACCGLGYLCNRLITETNTCIDRVTEAITKNTEVTNKLATIMGGKDDDN